MTVRAVTILTQQAHMRAPAPEFLRLDYPTTRSSRNGLAIEMGALYAANHSETGS
jgi:hypothetical protein